jgi:hypothetical protein
MSNSTGPIEYRHHTLPNGAVIEAAAWRVGLFFIGRATVTRPDGSIVGRFLTATGKSLEDVHEQLLHEGRSAYKEP